MIKPQKNSPRVHMQDLNNNNDKKGTIRSPLEYYNSHIRKTGQPILNQEEYTKMMREQYDKRKKEPGETQFIIIEDEELNKACDKTKEEYHKLNSEDIKPIDSTTIIEQMIPIQRQYEDTIRKINKLIDESGITEDKLGEPEKR